MLKVVSSENMNFLHEGKLVDFDRYNLEEQSQISTKQISIVIDFKNEEISGDIVAHGDWYDLSVDECLEYIRVIDNPIRSFDNIIKKYNDEKNYEIEIEEVLLKIVKVKANSIEQALKIVQDKYYNEEIILDESDFYKNEFNQVTEF